jgi:hypothetical protein
VGPGQDQRYSLERAREFIAGVQWTFAKTMAHYNPHEYIVERVEGGDEFTAFVAFVRSGPISPLPGRSLPLRDGR